MGYKSILTVVTNPDLASRAVDAAIDVARREGGHLEVLCVGVDRTQTGYYYAGASAMILQQTLDRAQSDADTLASSVTERMGREDLAWSCETAVAQIAGLARLVAERARFCDLVVLPRPYGPGRDVEDEAVLEAALFEGDVPVLVVPDSGLRPRLDGRVVVAWNESREAMRAVRAAMPIMTRADLIDIAIVNPPAHGADRSDPGGRLSQMISRHGARVEVSVLAKTMPRVSDVLRRHVTDRDADLIVMGAYGHSRFREAILGGATRNMLEACEVPVLLAH
jgi:nucleotide-binding universal stress UspA family protein